MLIATWNVNSIRARIDSVRRFLELHPVDIFAMQELRCGCEDFPADFFIEMGYPLQVLELKKGSLGVAVVSRVPLGPGERIIIGGRDDKRHLSVKISGGIELHNFYVPAGGYLPDRIKNPKFDHKLRYLDELANWFETNRTAKDKMVLVGDLNVAPLEHDVWSHQKMKRVVSHTVEEISRFNLFLKSCEWLDAPRKQVPADQKLYSWWSYRSHDWRAKDYGRRLDHLLMTPALENRLLSVNFVRETRSWQRPSDHIPLIMELDESDETGESESDELCHEVKR